MRISFYSPLPPARTGVADYSTSLIRELRRHADVEENPAEPRGLPLYHIGNNSLHRDIYRRALRRPGVVVLHDAVLHHFFLGVLDEAAYATEFVFNYGEWYRELAHRLWRGRSRSAQDPRYFRCPLLRRVVETSRAVIVHNPAAAAMVRDHHERARVFEIPHLWEPPAALPEAWRIERLRHQLGVPGGGFLFGVLGHLRESKRLVEVLRAFERVRRRYPLAHLLVAGDIVSRDLARTLEPMLGLPGLVRRPFLEERDFWLDASALDACINLRHPAAGETSGIAIRLMGLGKPVLLSDGPESARYPPGACLRIDTGAAEQEMLEAYMLWLSETPAEAAMVGRRAAAHVRANHAVGDVARLYMSVLNEVVN